MSSRIAKLYPNEKIQPKKSSEEVAQEVRAFLAKGGKIREVGRGETSYTSYPEYKTRQQLERIKRFEEKNK